MLEFELSELGLWRLGVNLMDNVFIVLGMMSYERSWKIMVTLIVLDCFMF